MTLLVSICMKIIQTNVWVIVIALALEVQIVLMTVIVRSHL